MIQKVEWNVVNHSDRDISRVISEIDEKEHSQDDLVRLLTAKEHHLKHDLPHVEAILSVLTRKPRKHKDEGSSNLCHVCYEEVGSSKYWCRICGMGTCKKCLIRQRQFKDETVGAVCDKCDQDTLRAMSAIRLHNQSEALQKCYSVLVQEQQGIETLVSIEKEQALQKGAPETVKVVEKSRVQDDLTQQNSALKANIQDLKKKVEFGKKVKKDLRLRLQELRKKNGGASFGSVSNPDSSPPETEVPRLDNDLDLSIENVRASMITSTTNDPQHIAQDGEKCRCSIY